MNARLQGILANNDFFIIMSNRTGRPYVQEDGKVHLYDTANVAKRDAGKCVFARLDGPARFDCQAITAFCLSYGVREMVIHSDNRNESYYIGEIEERLKRYKNPSGTSTVNLLKQNKLKKDISTLLDREYVLPVVIEKASVVPVVKYCRLKGKKGGGDSLIVAFSSAEEFDSWKKNGHGINYSPVMVQFGFIKKLSDGGGIIIDPASTKLIITAEMLGQVSGRGDVS